MNVMLHENQYIQVINHKVISIVCQFKFTSKCLKKVLHWEPVHLKPMIEYCSMSIYLLN